MTTNLEDKLKAVVERDGRYHINAYRFIYEGLDYTLKQIGRRGHVSGRQLLEGLKNLAIEQFGGLALMVLENWGVRRTIDFGNIVFSLVDAELMSRSENDSREEFQDVYDFKEVFRIDAAPRAAQSSQDA